MARAAATWEAPSASSSTIHAPGGPLHSLRMDGNDPLDEDDSLSSEQPAAGAASPVTLAGLLASRQVWQWQAAPLPVAAGIATGIRALDAVLPLGGWPAASLSEVLSPAPGLSELRLLLPVLARLSRAGGRVVLVAPPFVPCAIAWQRAGVVLSRLEIIHAPEAADALWAFEQCLRSGSCAAVLGWPGGAGHAALRRLQVAADHGQTLGVALRAVRHAAQPSPAALRLQLLPDGRLQVLKCRGGAVPGQPIALPEA